MVDFTTGPSVRVCFVRWRVCAVVARRPRKLFFFFPSTIVSHLSGGLRAPAQAGVLPFAPCQTPMGSSASKAAAAAARRAPRAPPPADWRATVDAADADAAAQAAAGAVLGSMLAGTIRARVIEPAPSRDPPPTLPPRAAQTGLDARALASLLTATTAAGADAGAVVKAAAAAAGVDAADVAAFVAHAAPPARLGRTGGDDGRAFDI